MSELAFKMAREADLEAVAGLYKSAIGQEGCTWSEDYPTKDDAVCDLRDGGLYVLWEDGEIVGAASIVGDIEFDDIDLWRVKGGSRSEIARICVARNRQGRGYSRLMLDGLIHELKGRGCRSIHLLVSKDNEPAIKTYRGMGFDFLGECNRFDHDFYVCEKLL